MPLIISASRVVQEARSWLGTPYHHQASVKGVGADCLGLLRGVWRAIEGPEPEAAPTYSSVWSCGSQDETLREALIRHLPSVDDKRRQIGDVLIFRIKPTAVAKHVGILVGIDTFIHAYEGSGTVETQLNRFWNERIVGVFRLPSVA